MVRRVPEARENAALRKAREKRERAVAERERKREAALAKKRAEAADYVVKSGALIETTDDLRYAKQRYWKLRDAGFDASLQRMRGGDAHLAVFHGRRFAGWITAEGRRIASTSRR